MVLSADRIAIRAQVGRSINAQAGPNASTVDADAPDFRVLSHERIREHSRWGHTEEQHTSIECFVRFWDCAWVRLTREMGVSYNSRATFKACLSRQQLLVYLRAEIPQSKSPAHCSPPSAITNLIEQNPTEKRIEAEEKQLKATVRREAILALLQYATPASLHSVIRVHVFHQSSHSLLNVLCSHWPDVWSRPAQVIIDQYDYWPSRPLQKDGPLLSAWLYEKFGCSFFLRTILVVPLACEQQ